MYSRVWFLFTSLLILSTSASFAAPTGPVTAKKHMFIARDGVALIADSYAPDGASNHPAVLLLHMLGRSNADYASLIQPLLRQGFIVVNLDLRGHGLSTKRGADPVNYKTFQDADWQKLPDDIYLVLKNIRGTKGVDKDKVVVIGASIGANAALMEAGTDKDVKAIVALSPGLDFHGLKPESAVANLHAPLLLVAAADDGYSLKTVTKLSILDKSSRSQLYKNGGHGTEMLTAHPELNAQLADWLAKAVQR